MDVLLFDGTHQTNRFDLKVVPVTAVGSNVLFSARNRAPRNLHLALFAMTSESVEAYSWCCQQLEDMVGVGPNVRAVFTDGLREYDEVVRVNFPEANHFRCLWHIEKQVHRAFARPLGAAFGKMWDIFKTVVFARTRSDYDTKKAELESFLMAEIRHARAEKKTALIAWMKSLFADHEKKFVFAFMKEEFTLGIVSTQRSEATNSSIKSRVSSRAYLGMFMNAVGTFQRRDKHKPT